MRRHAATASGLLACLAIGVPGIAGAATQVPATQVSPAPTTASTTTASGGAGSVPATTTGGAGAVPASTTGTAASGTVPTATTPAAVAASAGQAPGANAAGLPLLPFSVIGKAKVARDGTVSIVVQPQTAGKFTAFALIPAPAGDVEASAASVRPSPQPAAVPLPYGTANTFLPAPQPVRLYFRPGKAGREALIRLKRPTTTQPMRVTLDVSFAPIGGALTTVVYVVKVSAAAITLK